MKNSACIFSLLIIVSCVCSQQQIFEAEDADLTGVVVSTSGSGYSGDGYVTCPEEN